MRSLLSALLLGWAALGSTETPTEDAQLLEFEDVDTRDDYIMGIAHITRATNETTITHYKIYFATTADSGASKLQLALGYPHRAVLDNIGLPDEANPAHPPGQIKVLIPPIIIPADATALIVLSSNADGEKNTTACTLTIADTIAAPIPLCSNQTLTYPSAALDDGSGDANYSSAVEAGVDEYTCTWKINNTAVSRILFRMTYLELDTYSYDSVCVHDEDGTEIECYTQTTGAEKEYNVVSTGNYVEVRMTIRSATGGRGFRAVYYGLDANDYTNTIDDSVLKIRYDQHIPVGCHCNDVTCQGERANCIVDEGNGKGFSTVANTATDLEAIYYLNQGS